MPAGRPEKPIDWNLVDDLLMAGCKAGEIASHFDMHTDTLYTRTVKEKGMNYTDYSTEKRTKGESLLRAKQYAKALGLDKDGDNMMLIWLGKNRLDQRDTREHVLSASPETIEKLDKSMDMIDYMRSKAGLESKEG